jgi:hypothetical protein
VAPVAFGITEHNSGCELRAISHRRQNLLEGEASARSVFNHGHGKDVATGLEFRTMQGRKPNEQALAFRKQVYLYLSAIAFARTSLNKSP